MSGFPGKAWQQEQEAAAEVHLICSREAERWTLVLSLPSPYLVQQPAASLWRGHSRWVFLPQLTGSRNSPAAVHRFVSSVLLDPVKLAMVSHRAFWDLGFSLQCPWVSLHTTVIPRRPCWRAQGGSQWGFQTDRQTRQKASLGFGLEPNPGTGNCLPVFPIGLSSHGGWES